MKTQRRWIVVIGVAALASGGCSYLPTLQTDKIDYKSARKLPPLEIPPDLARPSSDTSYNVPDSRGETTFSAYSKERVLAGEAATTLLPATPGARIERDGNQRWLVVKADPKVVWNVARDFWEENGYVIANEEPSAGIIETDWRESREKVPDDNVIRGFLGKLLERTPVHTVGAPVAAAQRVKFRTRLEPGSEAGTTEVYISQRSMVEAATAVNDQPQWNPGPQDPEVEAEMLRKLMVHLGIKDQVAQTQAPAAPQAARATFVKDRAGQGMVSVNEQFDRAWRRVGLALDRVGFTVEDRDRSKGLYFVRYIDPDANKAAQSKGFLARINPFSKDTKQLASEQFRIQVKDAADTSQVSVLSKDGNEENSETASRILSLLYEQLK